MSHGKLKQAHMPQSARVAFEYPNFRYYMTARFLVTTASEMQSVAVGWQVYSLTHRPLDLGLLGLAQFLPGVLLFLVAGHTADRLPRQRILQACYAAFSLCSVFLLAFTLRGLTSVYPVYLALLFNGTIRAFNGPAGQAFTPLIVAEEHFPNAVAWSASIFQATITGPMLGGLLYGWTGSPIVVYSSAAISYLTALLLLSLIRVRVVARPRSVESLGVVLNGLKFIWQNKMILGALSLDLFAVLLGGAVALLPVYAREIRVGPSGLGVLRAAPGAGAIVMSIAVAHWPLRRRVGVTMLWCVFGFGVFTIVFGLSRNVALSVAALMLVGGCDTVSVIIQHTMIQLGTPDEMRGRVSAVNMIFIGASNEVGQFESGITAQWFGTVPAVILGGVGTIAIVAIWARLFPELRQVNEMPRQAEPVLNP
jgi:MFS family permease